MGAKKIELAAALGQRGQSRGDDPQKRVADFGDEMRQFALPMHLAEPSSDPVRISGFRGEREVLRTHA